MGDVEKEIERIDAGGDAWNDGDEVVQIDVDAPIDKVVSIQLSPEKWDALKKEADELGLGPTTLARMWVLECLRDRARAST